MIPYLKQNKVAILVSRRFAVHLLSLVRGALKKPRRSNLNYIVISLLLGLNS